MNNVILAVVFLAGCMAAAPARAGEQVTLTAADYSEAAARLADALNARAEQAELLGMLAVGPVDTDGCAYRVDEKTFQEEIKTRLAGGKRFRVNFAIDALKDHSVEQTRMKLMALEWEKEQAVNPRDLKLFGKLANVDYILFGRLSAQTESGAFGTKVTYTFNWKLGDCDSGEEWSHQEQLVRETAGGKTPEWITDPRGDSSRHLYELVSVSRKGSRDDQVEAALTLAQERFARRLNEQMSAWLPVAQPLEPGELPVEEVPGYFYASGLPRLGKAWLLVRLEQAVANEVKEAREEAVDTWLEARERMGAADRTYDPDEQARLRELALRGMRRVLQEYPVGEQRVLNSEDLAMELARLEVASGNPCQAIQLYDAVMLHTQVGEKKEQAYRLKDRLHCDEKKAAVKGLFAGRRIAVAGILTVDGEAAPWSKLNSELEAFFREQGAEVVPLDAGFDLEQQLQAFENPSLIPMLLPNAGFDLLAMFNAEGSVSGSIPEGAMLGSFTFAGSLHGFLVAQGARSYEFKVDNTIKPFKKNYTRELALDRLAISVRKNWAKYSFSRR